MDNTIQGYLLNTLIDCDLERHSRSQIDVKAHKNFMNYRNLETFATKCFDSIWMASSFSDWALGVALLKVLDIQDAIVHHL